MRAPRVALSRAVERQPEAPAPQPFKDTTPGHPFYIQFAVIMALGAMMIGLVALTAPRIKAVASGDGLLVYGVTANTTPQTRTYSGSGNSFGAAAGTVAGGTGATFTMRTSPTKIEAVSGYVDSSGVLRVACYDGISWTQDWNVTVGGTATTRRFDIAYETNSGDVMVLYSTNTGTTNELAYRTKAGSSACGSANWAAATNLDPVRTTGIVQWVKLAWDKRAAQNLITAIWADANSDLSAMQWSGTAWGNEPTAALATTLQVVTTAQDVDDFAVQYETSSGDVMVVWGIAVGNNANGVRAATCTGGTSTCTWSAVTTPATFADDATNLDLSASPNSDEMVFASIGINQSDLQVGYWSGSAWTNQANFDTSAVTPAAGQKTVATGWLVSGATTRSVVVYGDLTVTTTSLSYITGATSTFTNQTDFVGAPVPAAFSWFDIAMDPLNTDRFLLTYTDTSNDLFAKRLIMTSTPTFTWSNSDGSAALDTTIAQNTNSDFSFAFWRVIPASSLGQAAYRWFSGLNANDLAGISTNPSANSDRAHSLAIDTASDSMYVAGEDRTSGAANSAWRLEKRSLTNGDLDTVFGSGTGIVVSNPSASDDNVQSVVVDTTRGYLYAAGADQSPGNEEWRVEKRDLTNGVLDASFGTSGVVTNNVSSGSDYIKQVIIDTTGNYLYLVGSDSTTTTYRWRVEKRNASTGNLCSSVSNCAAGIFGTGGVVTSDPSAANSDEAFDGFLDTTNGYLYVAGYDSSAGAANTEWRIEKYNASTGNICSSVGNCSVGVFGTAGVVTSNPSATADRLNALKVDTTNGYIYAAGSDNSATNLELRIEKYNSTTGNICSSVPNCAVGVFGTSGVITNNPTANADAFNDITLDVAGGNIYAAGYENSATNTKWHYEKRLTTTGALVSAFGAAGVVSVDPSSGDDVLDTSILDVSGGALYSVGRDASPGNDEWRIARRDTTTGDASFVTALAALNTATTAPVKGTPFRLRMLLHANSNDLILNGQTLKLQFATRSGTCDTAFVGETYADVAAASGTIRYYDNSIPADGDTTMADSRDPTDGSFTVLPQSYEEANNFSNSVSAIPLGQDGLWDFSLVDNSSTAGTVFCFRVVSSAGAVIGSYSQIPQITTSATSLAPTSPAALAQKKTDNTVITTGSWVPVTSIKFTANVADADAADTLQLCVEKKAITAAFTNTNDACGAAVSYTGSAVAASVTLSGLTTDTEYHWQVRTKDAAGNLSAWVSYGGNSDVVTAARDFGLDSSAPTGGTVYDGTSAGVDQTFNNGSLSTLSANWSGVTTTASGLQFYEYSIGTSIGATDILGWTNNGTTTSFTVGSLVLRTTQIYYVNVRTTDNAGNTAVISSDGQLVQPSLSFSLSSTALNFLNLNAANSYTDTATTTLTTSTNAYGGYMVRAYLTQLLTANVGATIPNFSGGTYAAPAAWTGTGFGYTSSDTSIQGVSNFPSSGACLGAGTAPCYAPFKLTTPGDIVADHTANVSGTAIAGEAFTITTRVTTSATQRAQKYATVIIYTATPIY